MGYRSEIALKTTAEGYTLLKLMNDNIEVKEEYDRLLYGLKIEQTPDDFYRISHNYIKWYDYFEQVKNFEKALAKMNEDNIPYVFVRIGEEPGDVEIKQNWTDDMPDTLATFRPETDICDDDEGNYKTIVDE